MNDDRPNDMTTCARCSGMTLRTGPELCANCAEDDHPTDEAAEPLDMCPECGRWTTPYLGARILELEEENERLKREVDWVEDPDAIDYMAMCDRLEALGNALAVAARNDEGEPWTDDNPLRIAIVAWENR